MEKSTEIGFEEWNTLADDTVRQVKGLRLQLHIAEDILNHARVNRDCLRPKEEKTTKTPDTATDDVKTHAKQKRELIGKQLTTHKNNEQEM